MQINILEVTISDKRHQSTCVWLFLMFTPKKANMDEVEHVTAKKKYQSSILEIRCQFSQSYASICSTFWKSGVVIRDRRVLLIGHNSHVAVIAPSRFAVGLVGSRCFRMHFTWRWSRSANTSGASGHPQLAGINHRARKKRCVGDRRQVSL